MTDDEREKAIRDRFLPIGDAGVTMTRDNADMLFLLRRLAESRAGFIEAADALGFANEEAAKLRAALKEARLDEDRHLPGCAVARGLVIGHCHCKEIVEEHNAAIDAALSTENR